MLAACRAEERWATADEQAILARWAGWGAVPQVFDEREGRQSSRRDEVRTLLGSDTAWAQARRTTLNAHYTSAQVVEAMWTLATGLGFDGGRVLEPGCGSGNFIGFAPKSASVTGIELDATTAEIAQHLYGARADVQVGGFETIRLEEGSYDLAIGNVPFGQARPVDRTYNRRRHTLHNYFLLKSLHMVRPGGVVLALTSRYTLDATGPAARQEMAALADLVGALRLPTGAFSESSGTEVVIDLLVLRRRPNDEPAVGRAWMATEPLDPDDAEGPVINEYFKAHPEDVLGSLGTERGMYRAREITVEASGDLTEQLGVALQTMVARAQRDGIGMSAVAAPAPSAEPSAEPIQAVGHQLSPSDFELTWADDGSLVVDRRGRVGQVNAGDVIPYSPRFDKDRPELVRLIGLRDAARTVLSVQLDPRATDASLADAQETLRERYTSYLRLYGPINRSGQARTGRRDPETGEEVTRRTRPRMGGFRKDPDWPLVAALEDFDEDTQVAQPAAIFTKRVVSPPKLRDRIDTPAEAVSVCMDETGTVTIDRAAELLDMDKTAARAALGDLVFDDPQSGDLVPAAQYLSGNVRERLIAARDAAAEDPRFAANVTALEGVQPRQLEPGEIKARPGATWIPATDVERFCREVFELGVDVERLPEVGTWTTKLREGSRQSIAATSDWGTSRADALALLDAALNQRLYTVFDPTADGGRVRNDRETLAARDKQEQIAERFSTWVWEDPERAGRLAATYNELFASRVAPHHDGSHLTFPGLAETFVPRAHQRDAVARILADGRVLLAHAVGAGKTATMVMAAMEMRRLGAVSKPAVVVPNHMLEQFTREWLQLYPTARILVADKDRLSREGRKEFVARAATGDWDAIIFSHSGFARMPLRAATLAEYLEEEIDRARQALGTSQSGKALSVKRLEKRIEKMEETHKRLLDESTKDDGVCFDETGIDYVMVDEAHLYKNRRIITNIDGVAGAGSQRSQDLDAKLWALRRKHGPRCVTFATATPVANSVAELWVMEAYLHPDLLEAVGLRDFDSWAATFGRTFTALELSPDGSSYRMQTRFARFQNIPELLLLYRQVADIQTSEDLGLPVPDIVGGKATTVVVEPSDDLLAYVADLAARAEKVRTGGVLPTEDNMLKVTGDGRRAALDLRLVDLDQPDNGKVRSAAGRIAGIYHATFDRAYEDDNGQLSMRPGALQLVFCDVSTPAAAGWNAYDELRDALIERGVPDDRIRFIQSAKSDQAKAALFRACREGGVSVLIGSTETMGVGTNVQKRVVAIHHLDAPWRPADIEQRDGRGVRQGNANPNIHIVRYVTQQSFDIFMWQTLERKAGFIDQVTKGSIAVREIDDIGDQTLTFQEVKALATGNPLILEKAEVDTEVAHLARQERAHHDDQRTLKQAHTAASARIDHLTPLVASLEAAVGRLVDTRGDAFSMTVDGESHTTRAEAGSHLRQLVGDLIASRHRQAPTPLGELAGHTVEVELRHLKDEEREVVFSVPGTDASAAYLTEEWDTCDPTAVVQRIERRIQHLRPDLERAKADLAETLERRDRAATRLGQPWPDADRLASLRRRQAAITAELTPVETEPDSVQSDQTQSTDAIKRRLDAVGTRRRQPEMSTREP